MNKHSSRIKTLEKAMAKKQTRLLELKELYKNAQPTNPKSRSSFKGKITTCEGMIKSYQAQIKMFIEKDRSREV